MFNDDVLYFYNIALRMLERYYYFNNLIVCYCIEKIKNNNVWIKEINNFNLKMENKNNNNNN